MTRKTSIILPAKNEAEGLEILLPIMRERHPDEEIIVIDDISTDNTAEICKRTNVTVISHVYSMGNGAAINTSTRNARFLFSPDRLHLALPA